jgi:hypothetical protein
MVGDITSGETLIFIGEYRWFRMHEFRLTADAIPSFKADYAQSQLSL